MSRGKLLRLRLLAGALMILACGNWAGAQQAVVTQPGQANSGDASSTITTTNLFQQIWASQQNASGGPRYRNGCLVLNNSTDRQWVYFQGPGMVTPTLANEATIKAMSVPLEAAQATNGLGGYVYCTTGGGQTLQDSVWITGTSGDSYVAKQQ